MRDRNTLSSGQPFSTTTILQVWSKAKIIIGLPANEWRYDTCEKPIKLIEHGNTNFPYGWEIDHIRPVARGGLDKLANLQPLQWETNRAKRDTFPWFCS